MKSNDVVWITGAHGFIGRHLAQELSLKGKAVYGIGHGAWTQGEAKSSGVTGWLNGEISGNNLSELRALGGEPFCVFHLAGGSSVGVAIIRQGDNRRAAVAQGWRFGRTAMVEEFIPGRELTVSVMGDRALAVTDIIADAGTFYDYESKYADGGSHHIIPAEVVRAYAAKRGLSAR